MKCACSGGLGTSVLVVVGLVGLGLGGYNLITKGCPLGLCRHEPAAPTVPVSTAPSACPLAEGMDHDACCPDKSEAERAACCGHAPAAPAKLTTPDSSEKTSAGPQ